MSWVALLVDADDGHPPTARRPAEIEPHRHALAQTVDARDRADDLDERILELVLAAGRFADERAALAAVVDARDDAAIVALRGVGRGLTRGRSVGVGRHDAAAGTDSAARPRSRSAPIRSTNAGKVSAGRRSRS